MSAEPRLPSDAPTGPEPVLPSDRGPAGAGADVELPSARTAGNGRNGAASPEVPPAAASPPRAPAAPAPNDGGSRADRIRLATERGLLGGQVPAGYDAEDWETVRSANPFEVLYLDGRQPGAISAAVLDDRRQTLRAFWTQKNDLRSRGAGTQRDAIERRYGGSAVGSYAGNVERAYRRLADPEDRAREAQALDDARRRAGEAQIAELVDVALDDGVLTPRETTRILERGARAGLAQAEAADYLLRRLDQGGFAPRTGSGAFPSGVRPSDGAYGLAVEWVSAERRAHEAAAAADAAERARADAERARAEARREAEQAIDPRVPPIEFDRGAAHTLAELVNMCDRYPAEARRYLASGAIEQWLGRAGKAGAVVEAGERRRAHAGDPARALELFVRDLSRRIGRPDAPVLVPRTGACALGALPQGARGAARLEFAVEGRPVVWGAAHLAPDLPGARVSPTFADAGGGVVAVDVAVDTTFAAPGDYAAQVVVAPEGGAAVAVPLRFRVVPLALAADPPALDLGAVPLGGTRGAAVRLRASPPGGRLVGSAVLAAPHPGVTLAGGVGDDGGLVQLTVDARLTGPGVQYRSDIRFETNAGAVRVPVAFRIRRASTEAGIWAGGFAAAGGAGMWVARHALVPGTGWHLAYSWAPHAVSVVVAGVTLGVVGRVAGSLLRRVRKR